MENLRPLREDDAEAVAELYREAFGDDRVVDAEEVRGWVSNPELQSDWMWVLEIGGRVVGYGDTWIDRGEMAVELAAPGHWSTFFDRFEERARADGVSPVRVFVPQGHELVSILADRGYRYWRSAYTMQIGFDEEAPSLPVIPDGFEFRDFQPSDTDVVRAALNEAFEGDPVFHEATPGHFQAFYLSERGFDPSLWVLASVGDQLAGFILSFSERSGDKELGWVQALGVLPPWRRCGLGDALLRTAFHRMHARGLRRVGLGVDASNETNALRLYEGAGMRILNQSDSWVLDV